MRLEELMGWDGLRLFDAVLSLIVVVLLTASTTRRWPTLPPSVRRVVPWIVMTYVFVAYGHVELAVLDIYVPPGARLALTAINLMGLILALTYNLLDHSLDGEPKRRRRESVAILRKRQDSNR